MSHLFVGSSRRSLNAIIISYLCVLRCFGEANCHPLCTCVLYSAFVVAHKHFGSGWPLLSKAVPAARRLRAVRLFVISQRVVEFLPHHQVREDLLEGQWSRSLQIRSAITIEDLRAA